MANYSALRNSIVTKIFISFPLVSLLPIAALIAYNDWVNRRLVYSMKTEELKNRVILPIKREKK